MLLDDDRSNNDDEQAQASMLIELDDEQDFIEFR
jgi:hypothetical protein